MRQRLHSAITGPTATSASVLETLEYLAVHLAAYSIAERSAAAHLLALLLDVSYFSYCDETSMKIILSKRSLNLFKKHF